MKDLYSNEKSRLFIAAGFMVLMSINAKAQTREDAKALQAKTNFSVLSRAQSKLKKTVVTDVKLQAVAKRNNLPFRFETKDGKIAQMVAVEGNGNPLYLVTHNEKAAITSGVNKLRPGGASNYNLTGKNVKILEWDGGHILANHYEIDGRIILAEDAKTPPVLSQHSTHVAGTMIAKGVYKPATGMAPEATIKSWDFNNNYLEIYNAMNKQEGILSNHSYGFDAGWVYSGSKYVGQEMIM